MRRMISTMALWPMLAMSARAMDETVIVIRDEPIKELPRYEPKDKGLRLSKKRRAQTTTNLPPADDQPVSRQVRRQMERKRAKSGDAQ